MNLEELAVVATMAAALRQNFGPGPQGDIQAADAAKELFEVVAWRNATTWVSAPPAKCPRCGNATQIRALAGYRYQCGRCGHEADNPLPAPKHKESAA